MTDQEKELAELEKDIEKIQQERPEVIELYDLAIAMGPEAIEFTINELNKKKQSHLKGGLQ